MSDEWPARGWDAETLETVYDIIDGPNGARDHETLLRRGREAGLPSRVVDASVQKLVDMWWVVFSNYTYRVNDDPERGLVHAFALAESHADLQEIVGGARALIRHLARQGA